MKKLFNLVLREFISFSLTMFYRQWIVTGRSNVPHKEPVIFAGNHQNALIDPLLITCSSRRLPYYLARASAFKNPIAAFLLRTIRIMPIYRFRDGINSVRKNESIMGECADLLSKGEMLTMFPEGNHDDKWQVRPMQKGLARIAFQSEESYDWNLGLKIVPVGIQFEEPKSFRSRVLVNFGEPIEVQPYKQLYDQQPREASKKLSSDLKSELEKLVIHIPEERYEEVVDKFMMARNFQKNYYDQFIQDQKTLESVLNNDEPVHHPSDSRRIKNPISYIFSIWVLVNNILPYFMVRSLTKKLVKDPVFTSTIKYVLGLLIPLLFYLVVGTIIGVLLSDWLIAGVYILIQPGLGYFGGFDVLVPLFRRQ